MTWGCSQELYVFIIPYKSKVEQPGALQHNGMTNSETEMCMWKYDCKESSVKSTWKQLLLKMESTLH